MLYKDLLGLNNVLSKCVSSKDFPAEAMIKMIDLKEELQKEVDKYSKLFGEVMKQYKVVEKNSIYDWKGHEDETAITKKVEALLNSDIPIKNTNFLDAESFIKIIPDGLTLNELAFIGKSLRKEKTETKNKK